MTQVSQLFSHFWQLKIFIDKHPNLETNLFRRLFIIVSFNRFENVEMLLGIGQHCQNWPDIADWTSSPTVHCQTWPACLIATVSASADSKPPPSTEYYLDGGSICLLFSILLAGSVNLIAKTISASQSCLSDLLCTFFILGF